MLTELMVKKLVVGQLSTNCYLLFDKKSKELLIVDPGDDAEFIMRIISDLGVKPTKIFATHGHFDHILAVSELKLAYEAPRALPVVSSQPASQQSCLLTARPAEQDSRKSFHPRVEPVDFCFADRIPFLMNKKDEFLLARMQESAKFFINLKADPPPKIDSYIEEMDELKIGNCKLKIIGTPGHTPGSTSLYYEKGDILLCGDLIFSEGITGRTDFAYSSQEDIEKSVEKILNFPAATKVLTGHGEETTIKKLKLYNWYN